MTTSDDLSNVSHTPSAARVIAGQFKNGDATFERRLGCPPQGLAFGLRWGATFKSGRFAGFSGARSRFPRAG